MSSPVITVDINRKAVDAARIMVEHRIGSVVVIEGEKAVGIVTERDLLERVLAMGKDASTVGVREIMSSPLITISKDAAILEAIRKMTHNNIRRLVIMEGDRLIGLVTEKDILRAVAVSSLTSFHSLLTIKRKR